MQDFFQPENLNNVYTFSPLQFAKSKHIGEHPSVSPHYLDYANEISSLERIYAVYMKYIRLT